LTQRCFSNATFIRKVDLAGALLRLATRYLKTAAVDLDRFMKMQPTLVTLLGEEATSAPSRVKTEPRENRAASDSER
jgi:hypothetical protein